MDVMLLIWERNGKWESEGEAWSEDESVSSSGSRERNVCNEALHVIGLYGPGDKISLSLSLKGLGAGKGGIGLSHGARKCMRPGRAMLRRRLLSLHEMPSLTVDGL